MYPVNFPTKPEFLWKRFYDFTRLPRPSHKEVKVQEYLRNLADSKGLKYKEDKAGNIVIYVPASSENVSQETLIIQNHIDMVCDHAPGIEINFETDPIELEVKGNILTAKGTTLGADNGIGCAAALALLDEKVEHPPLELLFTVEEETGLFGAANLDPNLVTGSKMINLDTEEFGSFYIGCAGGLDFDLERPIEMVAVDKYFLKLNISGLIGGHSGIDIHRGRGNSIKLLNECLLELELKNISFLISELNAGKAKNIIPRDSFAIIGIEKDDIENVEKILEHKFNEFLDRFPEEKNLKLDIEHFGIQSRKVIDLEWGTKILDILNQIPHGAYDYFWESKDPLARYSSNLAVVHLKEGEFFVLLSMRFTEESDIAGLSQNVSLISKRFNLKLNRRGGYPGWKPNFESQLLKEAKNIFQEKFNTQAEVAAIHAGLECGVLKSRISRPIDCLSFGPNIRGAHSPDECVEIDSVDNFWTFLVEFINYLSKRK